MSTFLVLQQDLAAQTGLDQTVSNQATLLKRWINTAQQKILRAFEWPFNRAQSPLVVQTVVDISTGTVATTLGSTTITFSSAPAVSVTGYYIQTSSSNDWYKITAHTAATTTATIEIAALFTDATATFIVRKVFYSTNSSVDRIIQISENVTPFQLQEVSPEFFQSFNPGFLETGIPRVFMPAGLDASGYPQFRLWPSPTSTINLSVDYLKTATDMTADGDVSVIPAKWHTDVLMNGAKVEAYEFLDDTRQELAEAKFMKGVEDMKTEYEIGMHRHRVMTSVDQQPTGGGLGYLPLPSYYPRGN